MTFLTRLFAKRDDRATVRPLWHRTVEIAREKAWYAECGVADTVPGRFDAVTLVLALVMLRMERDKTLIAHSVRLTELFVDDMDGQLRQSGVGDLVVGKRMGKLMGVLGGRIGVLREALAQGREALVPVLERNVTLIAGADKDRLAAAVLALAGQLDAASDEDLLAARIAR
ncbi:ubiquinol-cytochrome C chaperone family protein [Novosphingobium album (ex Liu et al. 2023)]|uniref:Ubiquinol-cytochrome C chaperone family protein n=1 Tax=Novosphingobium album (ex Liu et al. 2023) TaxID=3031130 RepID=A0ABT5WSZ2_9SPHN|nr:ubiquinol-cytochrome C chaperone family protein [Novosphingobium album (ex Liu et al. 2023)]MDE8653154.1 ubiquinol-cytochrome C chaperone family protein [Novosphingobium album (ex Liu et al. 2023)]